MSIPLITPNLARVVLAHPKSNAGRKTIATRYGVIDLTRTRSAHWLAEVNVVVRQSNAARQFAASSWLDGRSNGKAIPEAKASSPAGPLRVRMALANSALSRSDRGEQKERAWFVYGSDARSTVHRPLGNLAIARSGRESTCHGKEIYLVERSETANSLMRPLQLP